jgi:hypothetical protein
LFAIVSAIDALSLALVTVIVLTRSLARTNDPAPALVMLKPETAKVMSFTVFVVETAMASGVPDVPSNIASEFWTQLMPPGFQFPLPAAVLQLLEGPAEFHVSVAAWTEQVRAVVSKARRAVETSAWGVEEYFMGFTGLGWKPEKALEAV